MYSLPVKSTVNAPTLEATRNKKAIKERFFMQLNLMKLFPEPGVEEVIAGLKKTFERSPVVAIDRYLSRLTDPEERTRKRNIIYNIKSPD